MKTIILIVVILNTLFLTAYAKGGHEGNGGDSIALKFTTFGRDVLEEVRSYSESFQEVNIESFENAIEKTDIITTDEKLFVGDIEKDAINYPEQKMIKINRTRWSQAESNHRKALVFHEYLGIMKVDDSKYQVSGRLLKEASENNSQKTVLATGNYRLLVNNTEECDIHVEVNTNVNKIFLTLIDNQRSRTYCSSASTYEFKCKNDKCSNSTLPSVQLIDDKGFLWGADKYVFVGNTEILPATKFTRWATHGFINVQGQSSTQNSRCMIRTTNGSYIYCDDKEFSRLEQCDVAQVNGEKLARQQCENYTGKRCRISNPGTQKIVSSWGPGIYEPASQTYKFSAVNLYCRIEGVVAVSLK